MSVFNLYPTIKPTLSFDFVNAGVLDPSVTFTRTTSATYFDETGILRIATPNTPRFDFNPSTLAPLGFLIEEARTNSIRNNTMVGAVAGTPGTLPTNWTSQLSGLTQTIVGTGTSNGVTYVDIRFNGTTTNTFINVNLEGLTIIAASNGQSWTNSSWLSIVGGTTTNITFLQLALNQYSSVPVYLSTLSATNRVSTISSTLTRITDTYITNNASTAFVQPILGMTVNNASAVDITLRIGLPQLELGAFATSVIPTTTTALTRSADVASVNTLTPWWNSAAGTFYVENQQLPGQTATVFPRILSANDGTTSNAIDMLWRSDTSRMYMAVTIASSLVADVGANGVTQTNVNKIAGAFATNDFATSVNGGSAATDTSGSVPTGINILRLGAAPGVSGLLNGYLRRISYYPVRLSNAQLQNITA